MNCYLFTLYSQYCYSDLSKSSYLYYRKKHPKRYILCYCPLTHNYYIIFVMFYIGLLWNLFFLKNIISVVSWTFSVTMFLKQSRQSINFEYDQQHNSKIIKLLLLQNRNHLKTEHYWGLSNSVEVDPDSDINRLVSGTLRKSTTVPSQF